MHHIKQQNHISQINFPLKSDTEELMQFAILGKLNCFLLTCFSLVFSLLYLSVSHFLCSDETNETFGYLPLHTIVWSFWKYPKRQIKQREARRFRNGWIFEKFPKGGGHFRSKKFRCKIFSIRNNNFFLLFGWGSFTI